MSNEKNTKEALRWLQIYISTRYPNGLPDITPEKAYFEEDAQAAIDIAETILDRVLNFLEKGNESQQNISLN